MSYWYGSDQVPSSSREGGPRREDEGSPDPKTEPPDADRSFLAGDPPKKDATEDKRLLAILSDEEGDGRCWPSSAGGDEADLFASLVRLAGSTEMTSSEKERRATGVISHQVQCQLARASIAFQLFCHR